MTEPMQIDDPPTSTNGEEAMQVEKEETPESSEKQPEDTPPSADEMPDAINSKSDDDDTKSDDDDDTEDEEAPKNADEALVLATTKKDLGNAEFKNGRLSMARRNYLKGTDALKPLNQANTGDDQVKALLAVLYTNLSMVSFKQGQYKVSRNEASQALSVDPNNVKALYRRAVAGRKLGDCDEARTDLRKAYKLDPSNTAVKKELAAVKKELEDAKKHQKQGLQKAFFKGDGLYGDLEAERKRKEEKLRRQKEEEEREALKKRKQQWEDDCVKMINQAQMPPSFEEWDKQRIEKEQAREKARKEEARRKRKEEEEKRKAAAAKNQEEAESSDDELTEQELSQFRGYKKTADGRVTSYFTREQSEHEKSLIGDIAPKRLTEVDSTPQLLQPGDAALEGSVSKPSAWNRAGTWEERDTTEWCKEKLTSRLMETRSELFLVAQVVKVDSLTGDAAVAITAGKKRYIFDFHATMVFEVKDPADNDVVAKGTLLIPDICSTHHEELEVNFGGWKQKPEDEYKQPAVDCFEALIQQTRENVKLWVKDFNEMY